MSKKTATQDRKARLAEVQRAQKAADRRRTLAVVGAAVAVVVVMAGAVVFAIVNEKGKTPNTELAKLGVSASAASCDPVTNDKATGGGDHIGPGTNKPDVARVNYATVPPAFGQHWSQWEFPNRQFYTAADRPRMESLVHNLEHGYTVIWYDDTIKGDQLDALKSVAKQGNALDASKDKVIVSPWDTSYGAFPAGKHIGISHWSVDKAAPTDTTKQMGHRLMCGQVSGAVIKSFLEQHPRTDAPEPNAS